jgi:hypothetical protein
VNKFYGDGAFDTIGMFSLIHSIGAKAAIKIRGFKNNKCNKYRRREVKGYKNNGYKKWAEDIIYGMM